MKNRPPRRAYRMTARAEAAARTHRRILDAAVKHFGEHPYDDVSLADVAKAAGVTVQTVLRRFGSKEELTRATAERESQRVREERWRAPPGDVDGAMENLLAHYESWGDRVLHLLAQEQRVPTLRQVVDGGRALHHEWVEHAFAPWLTKVRGAARVRRRAALIAATDVYVWKIVRRDLRLDASQTLLTLRALVTAALA
jgi:AcrR family transcriptional regulator